MVYVTVKVNEKGQIVIPKVLRDAYGIEQGGEVTIGEEKNKLVIERKMTREESKKFLEDFPKWGKVKIDSDKDYEEELDNR